MQTFQLLDRVILTDALADLEVGSVGMVISVSDSRPGEESYLVRFERAYAGVPAFALDLVERQSWAEREQSKSSRPGAPETTSFTRARN